MYLGGHGSMSNMEHISSLLTEIILTSYDKDQLEERLSARLETKCSST